MQHNNVNQNVLKIASIFIVVSAIFLAIVAMVISNEPGKAIGKSMGVASTGIFFGLLGALCFSAYSNVQARQFSFVGICIAGLGFLMSALSILFEFKGEYYYKIMFSIFIVAIAAAQMAMLYKIEILNKWATITRIIAISAIAIFSVMMIVLIFSAAEDFASNIFMGRGVNQSLSRAFVALLAIDFGFTAVTPIVNKLDDGKYTIEDPVDELLQDVEN